MPVPSPQVADERARRWWQRGRPVRTLARAATFVDDVGFALLFPIRDRSMPSLYEAASERGQGDGLEGWGPDAQRIWAWKDELPARGLAWYGRFVRGRQSLLSLRLLRALYERAGEPGDFADARLGPDALEIARILLLNGPTSTAVLREATAAAGPRGRSRFDKAVSELGRRLVVTGAGVERQEAGWPATILDLTARAFDLRDPERARRGDERRLYVARAFLDTMIQARPYELGNAFGGGAPAARRAFDELVRRGEAERIGPAYRLTVAGPKP